MNMISRKFITIVTFLISASFFAACSGIGQSSQVPDLTEDEQAKEEVFDQILADQDLFNDFMDHMMENEGSMHWMMDHDQMMQHMYSQEHMQEMMNRNQDMHDHMMQNMMGMMESDSAMYMQMRDRMQHSDSGMGHMHE